jgi:hypothetical protein
LYALPDGSCGIFVGGGASVRVPQLIGVPRMVDMMLTGRTYGQPPTVPEEFSEFSGAFALAERFRDTTDLASGGGSTSPWPAGLFRRGDKVARQVGASVAFVWSVAVSI